MDRMKSGLGSDRKAKWVLTCLHTTGPFICFTKTDLKRGVFVSTKSECLKKNSHTHTNQNSLLSHPGPWVFETLWPVYRANGKLASLQGVFCQTQKCPSPGDTAGFSWRVYLLLGWNVQMQDKDGSFGQEPRGQVARNRGDSWPQGLPSLENTP